MSRHQIATRDPHSLTGYLFRRRPVEEPWTIVVVEALCKQTPSPCSLRKTLLEQNVRAESKALPLGLHCISSELLSVSMLHNLWMPCYAVAGGSSLAGGVFLSSTGRREARIQCVRLAQSNLFLPLGSSANALLQRRVLYIRHSEDATITG